MIKSARETVYDQLKNTNITDEGLLSPLARAEELIKSRPLTYQSAELHDVVSLTLNHLFI